MKNTNHICYFYNTGGCNVDKCRFLHIQLPFPMEKPQGLKIPCIKYHTHDNCINPYCTFGHARLSKKRWKKYFPQTPFNTNKKYWIGFDHQITRTSDHIERPLKLILFRIILKILYDVMYIRDKK